MMKGGRTMSGRRIGSLAGKVGLRSSAVALGMAVVLLPFLHGPVRAGSEPEGSCVACHKDPDFMVQNKHLHEYFQNWRSSVHGQEDVSCEDCHAGNPEHSEKDAAHGPAISADNAASPVNFRNIAKTCGDCHEDMLDGFSNSVHFEHIVAKKQEKQGPTCVTCHQSMNVEVLNVTTVRESCARCHNQEKDNHPENPEKAEIILNRFLSIHRLSRYIMNNAEPEEAQAFFAVLGPQLHALSVTWHTFDLDEIEKGTDEALALLHEKREELRARKKKMKNDQAKRR